MDPMARIAALLVIFVVMGIGCLAYEILSDIETPNQCSRPAARIVEK